MPAPTSEDLGIHTEMFSDGVLALIESGRHQQRAQDPAPGQDRRQLRAWARRRLFDFVDDNPLVEFHPTDYVNDPFIIAQNERMVAINAAIEVDLTGPGLRRLPRARCFYSGIGGQVDFIRGAARSKGGKPIIALPSTAEDGAISRIVPT